MFTEARAPFLYVATFVARDDAVNVSSLFLVHRDFVIPLFFCTMEL